MNRTRKAVVTLITGITAVTLLSIAAYGGSDHDSMHSSDHKKEHAAHNMHQEGTNPLIEEMVKLDTVFREVVSGVSLGDGHRVHEALEAMHGTMEKTHEGVHHGTVTLRKNADRLKDFVEQDKQFHAKLEDLAGAARRSDGNAMLSLTKDLLDRCVKCHADFRLP